MSDSDEDMDLEKPVKVKKKSKKSKKKKRKKKNLDTNTDEDNGIEMTSKTKSKKKKHKSSDGSETEVSEKKKSKKKKKKSKAKDEDDEENSGIDSDDNDDAVEGGTVTNSKSKGRFSLSTSLSEISKSFAMSMCDSRLCSSVAKSLNIGVNKMLPVLSETDQMHDVEISYDDPDNTVLNIVVHSTDELAEDPLIFHPLVRVSIVDSTTGKYLLKEDKSMPASSFKEMSGTVTYDKLNASSDVNMIDRKHHQKCKFITPQLTHASNIGGGSVHLVAPSWDAESKDKANSIVFQVDLKYILRYDVIIFFELLDFGSSIPYDRLTDGFYRIAWGFLRSLSHNGIPNIYTGPPLNGKEHPKMRLQLYKFAKENWINKAYEEREVQGEIGSRASVFHSFRQKRREYYPSTMYVTVQGVERKEDTKVKHRAMLPNEIEVLSSNFKELLGQVHEEVDELDDVTGAPNSGPTEKAKLAVRRHRLNREPCLVPNSLADRLSCGKEGCFTVEFSRDGQYLAAACVDDVFFPVKIYEIPSNQLKYTLLGHNSLVYEICWNYLDNETEEGKVSLVTASGDGTVKIWSIPSRQKRKKRSLEEEAEESEKDSDSEDEAVDKKKIMGIELRHTLYHTPPQYVYTAHYHPSAKPALVVTGSYDSFLRLWDSSSGKLLGKLDKGRAHHKSRVNSCCFSNDGNRLVSGDGSGVINVWRLETGRLPSDPNAWHLARMINDNEFKGKPILSIRMHPKDKLLLVTSHQHVMRLFELRRYTKVHNGFIGAHVSKSTIRSCFSPDGQFVLCGGEDGKPHFWNTLTAYPAENHQTVQLGFTKPLYDVSWHPTEHLVAYASYGGDFPVMLVEAFRNASVADSSAIANDEKLLREQTALQELQNRQQLQLKLHNEKAEHITRKLDENFKYDSNVPAVQPKSKRLKDLSSLRNRLDSAKSKSGDDDEDSINNYLRNKNKAVGSNDTERSGSESDSSQSDSERPLIKSRGNKKKARKASVVNTVDLHDDDL